MPKRNNNRISVAGQLNSSERTLCVEPRLRAGFLKSLICVGLMSRFLPFRQHQTIGVLLHIIEIDYALLIYEICTRALRVHLKGKNSMLQKVNGTELFVFYFAFFERGLPFFSEFFVGGYRAL